MTERWQQPMQNLDLHHDFDQAWATYRRIPVGRQGRRVDYYIPLAQPGLSPLLVTVRVVPGEDDGVEAFDCAMLWAARVIVGIGQRVYFVSVSTPHVASHRLGDGANCDYFGHFYAYAEFLLVASGRHLTRFDKEAQRVWHTPPLAVDGVLVERVEGDAIYGQGDQAPPGGWRPFVVALESGAVLG